MDRPTISWEKARHRSRGKEKESPGDPGRAEGVTVSGTDRKTASRGLPNFLPETPPRRARGEGWSLCQETDDSRSFRNFCEQAPGATRGAGTLRMPTKGDSKNNKALFGDRQRWARLRAGGSGAVFSRNR
jgi:hypothetical protein